MGRLAMYFQPFFISCVVFTLTTRVANFFMNWFIICFQMTFVFCFVIALIAGVAILFSWTDSVCVFRWLLSFALWSFLMNILCPPTWFILTPSLGTFLVTSLIIIFILAFNGYSKNTFCLIITVICTWLLFLTVVTFSAMILKMKIVSYFVPNAFSS